MGRLVGVFAFLFDALFVVVMGVLGVHYGLAGDPAPAILCVAVLLASAALDRMQWRIDELRDDNRLLERTAVGLSEQVRRLRYAAESIYYAGYWSCDRKVNEAALWERLRDALSIPHGTSPPPNRAPTWRELVALADAKFAAQRAYLDEVYKPEPNKSVDLVRAMVDAGTAYNEARKLLP